MICDACKRWPHTQKPDGCKGGTWCDCQHKHIERNESQTRENNVTEETAYKMVEADSPTLEEITAVEDDGSDSDEEDDETYEATNFVEADEDDEEAEGWS